jgi:hypothetical protein
MPVLRVKTKINWKQMNEGENLINVDKCSNNKVLKEKYYVERISHLKTNTHNDWIKFKQYKIFGYTCICIGYSIPGHSIWKRMPWGEVEMHFFSYINDQVLYNQFSPYFLCRVSWLPIITNLGSLSQTQHYYINSDCIMFIRGQ